MSNDLEVYPLATATGESIPADFIYPADSIVLNASQVVMSAAKDIFPGKSNGICSIYVVGSPVVIGFGATVVTAPIEDTLQVGSMLLLPDTHYTIYCESNLLSVIGLSGTAQLLINTLNPWKALAIPDQFNRR